MKREVKAVIAGRILLPAALLVGCSIRINVVSLLYFVLLAALPFIPAPTVKQVSWLTVKYTQCVMGTALSASLAQLIFHVGLLASQPYGGDFVDCELYEKLARQFGFQRWDKAYPHQIVRLICPELLIAFTSVFAHRMYKKKSSRQRYTLSAGLFSTAAFSFSYGEKSLRGEYVAPEPAKSSTQHLVKITAPARTLSEHIIRALKRFETSEFWTLCKKASFALVVCGAGIAHPSLISFFYFVLFLIYANLWILGVSLRPMDQSRIVKALAAISGVHLFILYFYQFDFVQEFASRHSIAARILGLTAIYVTDCQDVRSLTVNPGYRSSYVLNVVALGLLYRNCIQKVCKQHRSSFELVVKETEERVPKGALIQAEIRRTSFVRRDADPENKPSWLKQLFKDRSLTSFPAVNSKDRIENAAHSSGTQEICSGRFDESESTKANEHVDGDEGKMTARSAGSIADGRKRTRVSSIFELRKKLGAKVDLTKRVKHVVRQYSYVGCLVVMMTWSVTYHSWLTFALLLLACAIWMVPNPRQFCLRITPYLVCYAEILLVFQYIYGFELSESELPSETVPILHQIGFVKPDQYPVWVHLFVKLCYTFVFWLTLKAYLRERQRQPVNGNSSRSKELPDLEAGHVHAESEPRQETSKDLRIAIAKEEDEVATSAPRGAEALPHSGTDECIEKKEDDDGERADQEKRPAESEGDYTDRSVLKRAQYKLSAVTHLAQHKNLFSKLVAWVQGKVTQLWIVVCCVVLLFISLRQPVVGYAIIYMNLLQIFINCFLISFHLWRKFLHYFWKVMIVYCMFVLTFIYTYQFRKFPEMWHYGTGWSYDVLESLGLEQYSSGELLMKLLTPISFLICTIIQLKFFHKQLIEKTAKLEKALEEAEKQVFVRVEANSTKIEKNASRASIVEFDELDELEESPKPAEETKVQIDDSKGEKVGSEGGTPRKFEVDLAHLLKTGCQQVLSFLRNNRHRIIELTWRLLEMHIAKVVAFQMIAISIREVGAIHLPYPIFVAVMLAVEKGSRLTCKLAGVWTSIVIFVKMIFQMKFVRPIDGFVNCSSVPGIPSAVYRPPFPFPNNRTVDPSRWAGFEKSDNIAVYLQPYLFLIGLLILQEFIRMRQTLRRAVKKKRMPPRGVLFEQITRREADDGLLPCLMYFINFFFYKFGLEICFFTTVATIGLRCDFVSLLYALWFIALLVQRRKRLARLWRFYVIFLAVLLPLQYLACVGIPPSICSSYPWSFINQNMLEWLYVPDFAAPPNAIKLGADFVQLLFACCQMHVFEIETSLDAYAYPGGDNSELIEPVAVASFKTGLRGALRACSTMEESGAVARKSDYEEPVTDFISYPKSYLDLLKIVLFCHLYWATLTVVFVAGVSRVTLFAMGYVVAGFLFLWVGNELFLKPLSFGLRLWDMLIFYNAVVIIIKTSLQVVGCVFLDDLYKNYCWGLQLFGIACLKSGFDPAKVFDDKILADCKVPTTEAGIIFDGICFCFLLLQRRIITSRYFTHVVTEFRAQHVFANRGAELIHKIRAKEIWERHGRERELVSKIKQKMEKIKEAQARMSTASCADQSDSGKEGPKLGDGAEFTPEPEPEPEGPDMSSLTQRTNQRRRRKRASIISSTDASAALPPSVSWLSPASAFNESMISSFRKCLSFSPTTAIRKASSAPDFSARSPDDVSAVERPLEPVSVRWRSLDSIAPCILSPTSAHGRDRAPSVVITAAGPRAVAGAPTRRRQQSIIRFRAPVDSDTLTSESDTSSHSTLQDSSPDPLRPTSDSIASSRRESLDQIRRTSSSIASSCRLAASPIPLPPKGRSISVVLENAAAVAGAADPSKERSISVVLENVAAMAGAADPSSSRRVFRRSASLDVDEEANDAAWDLDLQDEKQLVPENEEDRRKGLGPLQLLNVAFKKGDIKAAVEDAKIMEAEEEKMEKSMTEHFGKADKKAIKKALKKRAPGKVLPDFEEETFETDHISSAIVGRDYEKRSDVSFSQDEDESHESCEHAEEDTEEEAVTPGPEETTPVSASPSPERGFTTLLAQTFIVSRLLALWSAIVEFLNNTTTFLKLFLNGVLESTVTWLLKISREYRYVAHVLTEEKNSFKNDRKLLMQASLNRGPSLLRIPSTRKIGGYGKGPGGAEKGIKKCRGLSFYDRKIAEKEARKFNKDRNLCVRLFASTYYVLLSRSELFCYLMMVLAHMASAGLVTMPLPIMAFVWGTLSVPKPTKRFWIAVITYTEAIVIIKYLFQFGFFPWNKGEPSPSPFFPSRILGVERKDKYAAWDLALLMMLFFHRANLKALGLWKETKDTDADSLSSQQSGSKGGAGRSRVSSVGSVSFRHVSLCYALSGLANGEVDQDRMHVSFKNVPAPWGAEVTGNGRPGIWARPSPVLSKRVPGEAKAVQLMVPPVIPEEGKQVNEEDGAESGDDLDDAGGANPNSRLRRLRKQYRKMMKRWEKVNIEKRLRQQGTMVVTFFETLVNPQFRCSIDVYALMFLCDFICFAIVIFGYWAFGTETASGGIASYFEENKIPGPFLAMLVVQFVLIIIDRAVFLRKHLLGKVVYQIGLVFFIHVWMFFILPAVTERQFINNTPAKLWYFVKCIYFCLSAWQIRSGYPTRVLGNMLTKKYNYLNMVLFKVFMTIPFLFELRALMDWIWTDTSMSLSDWLKLEDIYANIYQIKCERQIEEDYPTPRGVKKRPLLKYGWGGFLLFLMILIIWFPLVLFSLANTVGVRSPPVDVTVKLTLGTYPPLFQMRAPEQTRATMTVSEFEELQYEYRYSKMATAYMSDYSAPDVIRVTFSGNSESVWSISPPSRLDLIRELNSSKTIALKFEWHFARAPDGTGHSNIVSDENLIHLTPEHEIRNKLVTMLNESSSGFIDLPRLYPPYVKVPGKGKAAPVHALMIEKTKGEFRNAFTNTTLHLLRTGKEEYWKMSSIVLGADSKPQSRDYIQMVGFVDKVFPSTFNWIAGGGIIGLYGTLVLVAGKFIRSMVTGAMSRIMYEELPNVDRILQLCLDIFLVREAGELALEEDLFAKLIFIYRSPATLIKWTKLKKT